MNWIAWTVFAFLCGSLPFSVLLGKVFLGRDVRRFGDGNPGATNAFRAGSKAIGLLVLILDVSKAAAPVGFAYHNLGWRGLPMFLIAVAPVLGHVFSPFLRFRGGKGLATALGVWIGLTLWKASLLGVIGAVIGLALLNSSGWAAMLGLTFILTGLLLWMPDPLFWWVWAALTLILVWTHRLDLRHRPGLRPWITRCLFRTKETPRHG